MTETFGQALGRGQETLAKHTSHSCGVRSPRRAHSWLAPDCCQLAVRAQVEEHRLLSTAHPLYCSSERSELGRASGRICAGPRSATCLQSLRYTLRLFLPVTRRHELLDVGHPQLELLVYFGVDARRDVGQIDLAGREEHPCGR